MKASELRPGQIEQIKRALKCARNALEKGIEVRMMDQWPALVPIVPDAIREVKAALEAVTGWDDEPCEPQSESKQLNIDSGDEKFELARALHRVVRAMHDGHCPKCGHLASSMEFEPSEGYHCCPECLFAITKEEADEALAMFLPYMQKNYDKFAAWQLHGRFVNPAPSTPEPQPFRAGDLVVCVDGWNVFGLLAGKLYRVGLD